MITSVSLNPSIDKSLEIDGFHYGSMNRVGAVRRDAGGKAINLSVALSILGLPCACVGFLGKENGQFIENRLLSHGISGEFVYLDGLVRTNLKLRDSQTGTITEINEAGVPVEKAALEQMTQLILRYAEKSDFLVLTGSLPPGCPKDYYQTIIEKAEGLSCKCVLDAEGAALKAGICAKPYLIKPNRLELELEVGHSLKGIAEVAEAARALARKGIARVAVSLGEKGALLTDGRETYFARALDVPVQSTVGAGDSMVAGMICGLMADLPLEETLRRGAACATASIVRAGTQLLERATFKEMLDKIPIERV
ncbi:MAG: 1-phosphofructokinase [Clostridia bacterium]